jgi:hypothetical protein
MKEMFHYIRFACVLMASTVAALAQPAIVAPLANVQTTGIVGIADAQTARLNLLNPGVQAPLSAIACTATVTFIDGDSNQLKSATFTVTPGKSSYLDLRSDTDLNLAAGDRSEIRAVISILTTTTIPPPPSTTPVAASTSCSVIPTLEIFDTSTGRTLVTLGHTTAVK